MTEYNNSNHNKNLRKKKLNKPSSLQVVSKQSSIPCSVKKNVKLVFEENECPDLSFLDLLTESNQTIFTNRKLNHPKYTTDENTIAKLFTKNFQQTMQAIRFEMQLNNDSLILEQEKIVEQELQSEEKHIIIHLNEMKKDSEESIIIPNCGENASNEDPSNSGLWNMIKANRGPYFYVSPPHNMYTTPIETTSCLDRPYISWIVIDESKKKCEYWMNERCQ